MPRTQRVHPGAGSCRRRRATGTPSLNPTSFLSTQSSHATRHALQPQVDPASWTEMRPMARIRLLTSFTALSQVYPDSPKSTHSPPLPLPCAGYLRFPRLHSSGHPPTGYFRFPRFHTPDLSSKGYCGLPCFQSPAHMQVCTHRVAPREATSRLPTRGHASMQLAVMIPLVAVDSVPSKVKVELPSPHLW